MANEQTYTLPSKLTISQAQQAHLYLHEFLECADTDKIIIDCDSLNRIDACGIQVLLALQKDAKRLHKSITWKNLNEVFTDSIKIMGVEDEFEFQINPSRG